MGRIYNFCGEWYQVVDKKDWDGCYRNVAGEYINRRYDLEDN